MEDSSETEHWQTAFRKSCGFRLDDDLAPQKAFFGALCSHQTSFAVLTLHRSSDPQPARA